MVRLRVRELAELRGITRYALAKATGLSLPTIYQLAREDGAFKRLEASTIDLLCEALGCLPGELFVRTAGSQRATPGAGAKPKAPRAPRSRKAKGKVSRGMDTSGGERVR